MQGFPLYWVIILRIYDTRYVFVPVNILLLMTNNNKKRLLYLSGRFDCPTEDDED
jgi:hypothetical protein